MIDDILNNNSSSDILDGKFEVPQPQQPQYTQQTPAVEPETNQYYQEEAQSVEQAVVADDDYEDRQIIEEENDNHAADHDNIFNDFFNDTFSEVSQYNKLNGEKTISDLTGNMVDEIRHGVEPEYTKPPVQEAVIEEAVVEDSYVEQPQYIEPYVEQPQYQQTYVEKPQYREPYVERPVVETQDREVSDEEFSNTVSMEISKVMDEISSIDTSRDSEPEETYTPPVVERPEPVRPARRPQRTEEHPVLAKRQEEVKEEEEVVEIKNLKELEAEPAQTKTGTISNTIPFVVATEEEDVIDDDDEDEGSNTILNIILVVLIIVLVAVLGLIIFYILKTKGII